MPTDRPVTVPDLQAAKERGEKLTVLTAYDATTARLLDAAGVDVLLVGDSLGMVVQGHADPIPVTLDDILYHTRCVVRGTRRALVVADLPFLTYQLGPRQALRNAGRLLQDGGAHAVKLEGGGPASLRAIAAIASADIPVMGHVGLTPQSVRQLGGFRVRRDADRLIAEAKAVAAAGAFAVVVECVPSAHAARITAELAVPTIGIGAGPDCDGQVLVTPDLLGQIDVPRPRFVKRYAELGAVIREAVANYCREVRAGQYPGPDHQFR